VTATLRRATEADLPDIAALLSATFPANPKADVDVLRWQYLEGPGAPASSWVFEEPSGVLVSHFTMLVLPAVVDGQLTWVGKSADAATLPSHRGRGLFPQAVTASLEDLRRRGAAGAIFSPSNPTSRRSLEALGMTAVAADVPILVRPVNPVRLRRDGRQQGVPTAPDRPIEAADAALLAAAADNCNAHVSRTPAWAAWRFANPSARYLVGRAIDGAGETTGVAVGVLRPRGRLQALYVLDLAGHGRRDRRSAVADLANRARGFVSGPLLIVAVAGTCPDQLFEVTSSGLWRVPARLSPGGFTFGMIALDGGRSLDGFDLTKRPWRLTWADLDHL